ncbi:MAG TPA: autotransporter outer membrane beta-barrel domain-containing protein [Rhodocyclaceae bacterium]|nr:autotransporter outer membrane beta-barrel domain-containing protein [Rhodocyclaceae bacterium]
MASGHAIAGLAEKPFLLRLSLSLNRSSNFSDTAARQASAAFPGGSSVNPAGVDWRSSKETPSSSGSLTNIQIFSESGARATATAGTLTVPRPSAGTLSIAYARTDTIDRSARQGLANNLRSNEFFAGYGRRVADDRAFGAKLRLTDSVLNEQFFVPPVDGLPLQSKVKARSIDAALGVLSEPRPGWFTGAVVAAGWSSANVSIRNLTPLPAPPFGLLPAGSILERFNDDVRTFGVHVGTGYAPDRRHGIFLDAQYLMVKSKRGGSAEVGRIAAGLDLRAGESVVFRTGVGIDSEKEVTLSIGARYQGFKDVVIDVAYQHNSQPEVKREFGRFDLLSASLNVRF